VSATGRAASWIELLLAVDETGDFRLSKSTWYTTPTDSYADYTALAQLPKVKLT